MFPGHEWGCLVLVKMRLLRSDTGRAAMAQKNGMGAIGGLRRCGANFRAIAEGRLCARSILCRNRRTPPPILWMEICYFQWFTRMIRYKVLLGKDLAAESSQERAYEPFRVCRSERAFHSLNSRIVDWREMICKG